jgi:hypothetical protein
MIEELTKQLEDLQIKNDNLTETDNKPTINWSKNKLITFCKNNNISSYSNCNKTKLLELIHFKKTNFINNISPLRYPGGKTKTCNKLYEILTTYFDLSKFTTIISPFFGGGSFEFHLQNTFPNYILLLMINLYLYTIFGILAKIIKINYVRNFIHISILLLKINFKIYVIKY